MIKEKGPWRAGRDRSQSGKNARCVFIESDDFTHDVRLIVDGDFTGPSQRMAYASEIARRLNAWSVCKTPED